MHVCVHVCVHVCMWWGAPGVSERQGIKGDLGRGTTLTPEGTRLRGGDGAGMWMGGPLMPVGPLLSTQPGFKDQCGPALMPTAPFYVLPETIPHV